jgi:hypothetical protein
MIYPKRKNHFWVRENTRDQRRDQTVQYNAVFWVRETTNVIDVIK